MIEPGPYEGDLDIIYTLIAAIQELQVEVAQIQHHCMDQPAPSEDPWERYKTL